MNNQPIWSFIVGGQAVILGNQHQAVAKTNLHTSLLHMKQSHNSTHHALPNYINQAIDLFSDSTLFLNIYLQ